MRDQSEMLQDIRRDWHLWPWFVASALVLGIGLAFAVGRDHANPAAPAASYSVAVTGTAPHIQTVGLPFDAHVTIQNTGAPINHMLMDLGGCSDHWVVDTVTANGTAETASDGATYDLGGIIHGDSSVVTVTLAPIDAGTHECDLSFYRDSTENPALFTVYWKPAINP